MSGECDHFLDPAEQRRRSLDGLRPSLSTLRCTHHSFRKPSKSFSVADPPLMLTERQTLPSLKALPGQSRESQASFVNMPSPTPSPTGPQDAEVSNAVLPSSPALPMRKYRNPSKSILDFFDVVAVIVSITCAGLALATISPHLHYAAQLQYTGQITIVGFLLSLMNHCLQKVAPFLFILIEARFGSSGLQNYDGLMRWSLWAERLHLTWKASIIFLLTLPLILSAVYKQFTGGTGWVQAAASKGYYGPTAAQGLKHAGGQTIMASAVHPYMAASRHDADFPDLTKGTQAYGYNILLLSNTSAAALDSPLPNHISHLQSQLTNIATYYLEADVRGTVTHYNSTADSHRRDPSFWRKYFPTGPELRAATDIWPWNRWYFGWQMLSSASDNSTYAWDPSWSFMGYYTRPDLVSQPHDITREFEQTARGFDTHRHACRGKWKVTRNSIELLSGSCDPTPLELKYQYLSNCQLPLTHYVELLAEFLGPFAESRKYSPWLLPTFSVVTAAMYSSQVADSEGFVWIQPDGPIWQEWNPGNDPDFRYNETYLLDESLLMEVPTMCASPGLYFVIILQPILTIMAFVSTLWLHNTPISRNFCLVSVLAGVDKDSLKLLEGASFSGKLDRSMRLQITALEETSASGERLPRLEYAIEESTH